MVVGPVLWLGQQVQRQLTNEHGGGLQTAGACRAHRGQVPIAHPSVSPGRGLSAGGGERAQQGMATAEALGALRVADLPSKAMSSLWPSVTTSLVALSPLWPPATASLFTRTCLACVAMTRLLQSWKSQTRSEQPSAAQLHQHPSTGAGPAFRGIMAHCVSAR